MRAGGSWCGPMRRGCTGSVLARWPRGQAVPSGSEAGVEATWLPRLGVGGRPAGTLVIRRVGGATLHSGFRDRLRTYLFQTSHRLYGARAGLVDALILGRRGGIDPELQDRFAWSGLVHLLSISGFHVGLITAWVILLGRLRRARPVPGACARGDDERGLRGLPRLAGPGHPRGRARRRDRTLPSATATGAGDPASFRHVPVVLLVDPWAILDLGGWLSAAALWGATTFSRWSDRVLGEHFIWRTFSSSVGATLATAPITAAALGTVAPIGIVLNSCSDPAGGSCRSRRARRASSSPGSRNRRGSARRRGRPDAPPARARCGGRRSGPRRPDHAGARRSVRGHSLAPGIGGGSLGDRQRQYGRRERRAGSPGWRRLSSGSGCSGGWAAGRLTAVPTSRYIFSTWGREMRRWCARPAGTGS